jgi:hypothetical protein
VKRFSDDVDASVMRINGLQPESLADVAIGITKDNWSKWRTRLDELVTYPVLVITHERYRRLSVDERIRRYFTRQRHTLVIDEALQVQTCEFSRSVYNKIQSYLEFDMDGHLRVACQGLIDELARLENEPRGNQLLVCHPPGDSSAVQEFAKLIEANTSRINEVDEVKSFVRGLSVLYSRPCVYNGGRLVTQDDTRQRWGLENNVILDANGQIDYTYELDEHIHIDRQTPIVNHSKWWLYSVTFNSSRSQIRRTVNYFDVVAAEIIKRKRLSDKTLVITSKDQVDEWKRHLSVEGIELAYFGNIIGKNDWRDFTQAWVVVSPNYRMEDYAVRWAAATGRDLVDTDLTMVAKNGALRFTNQEIESIRFSTILGEIYQAVKRVNRENKLDCEVYVVHKDPEIVRQLKKNLQGIKYGGDISIDVQYKNGGKKSSADKRADRLAKHLKSLPRGMYPKTAIRQATKIDTKNFGTVLKHVKIRQLVEAGMIRIHRTSIEVLRPDTFKSVG